MKTMKVGITGGIGSGKTTICKIFETLGVPVYYADDRAKYLMNNNLQLIKSIKNLFGNDAYIDHILNRKYISDIVFNNPEKLQLLNKIVHPAVQEDGIAWHQSHTNKPYTLRESALMIESGIYKELDKLIVVVADEKLRIKRVMQRDNVDKEAVIKRINQQLSDEKRKEFADFIIENNEKEMLITQITAIHQKLILF